MLIKPSYSVPVFNRPVLGTQVDEPTGSGAGGRRAGQTISSAPSSSGKGKGSTSSSSSSRASTAKSNVEKVIDTSKPHWTLRVVSDADKTVGSGATMEVERLSGIAFQTRPS